MKIEDIDVDSAINSVKELLGKEKDLSPALRSALEVLLILVSLLLNRLTLNSKNSSKPHRRIRTARSRTRREKATESQGVRKGVMEPRLNQ